MRLALRDLFWLILFAAGLTAWLVEHRAGTKRIETRRSQFANTAVANAMTRRTNAAIGRRRLATKYADINDAQLDAQLSALLPHEFFQQSAEYEPCLQEAARRRLQELLQKHYDALMARDNKRSLNSPNLELLTALRRAQGRLDPLHFRFEFTTPHTSSDGEGPPLVRVVVTNQDVGHEVVQFTSGGDYRGGRNERWRFHLTDRRGRTVRDSRFTPQGGGGVYAVGPLRHSTASDHAYGFDLRTYLAPPTSGHYQLQVFYHNEQCIADEPDLTGLVVAKSDPVAVIVHNPADRLLSSKILAPAAVMALAGALLAFSIGRARRIGWRDWLWFATLVAISIGFWMDERRQFRALAALLPDQFAEWSITADEP